MNSYFKNRTYKMWLKKPNGEHNIYKIQSANKYFDEIQ